MVDKLPSICNKTSIMRNNYKATKRFLMFESTLWTMNLLKEIIKTSFFANFPFLSFQSYDICCMIDDSNQNEWTNILWINVRSGCVRNIKIICIMFEPSFLFSQKKACIWYCNQQNERYVRQGNNRGKITPTTAQTWQELKKIIRMKKKAFVALTHWAECMGLFRFNNRKRI